MQTGRRSARAGIQRTPRGFQKQGLQDLPPTSSEQQSFEGGLGEKDSETTRNPQAGAGLLPHCELREAVAEAVSPLPLLPRVHPIEAIRSAWLLEAEI